MLAEQLAVYAHELNFCDLPDDVIHEAKRRIMDSFGSSICTHL